MWAAIKSAFTQEKDNAKEQRSKLVKKLTKKFGLQSGSAVRDDGQVQAGYAVTKGRRWYNEDSIYCRMHPLPNGQRVGSTSQVACVAVFDGHGGATASAFVRDNLFKKILAHESLTTDPFKAVEDAYRATDLEYVAYDEVHHNDDGCTAATAILLGRQLIIAHAGDSRAVLGHGTTVVAITNDHKPNRPDEKQRIEDLGGSVVHAGTWRVGGMLAVSRAFGNRQLKQYVTSLPEMSEYGLTPDATYLIMATDGLWDVVSNEEAVKIVSSHSSAGAEEAARALTAIAFDRGSADNISAVVCIFQFPHLAAGSVGTAGSRRIPAGGVDSDGDSLETIHSGLPLRTLDSARS